MLIRKWDFLRQFTVGMGTVLALAIATTAIALVSMHQVASSADRVAAVYAENALTTTKLRATLERRSSLMREYYLTGNQVALHQADRETAAFRAGLDVLRGGAPSALIAQIDAAELRYRGGTSDASAQRERGLEDMMSATLSNDVLPAITELEKLLDAFEARKEQQFEDAELAASASSGRLAALVGIVAALAVVAVVVLTILLRRGVLELTRGRAMIAASLERVEQSNSDLNAFAGRVAHDLRGALAPVLFAPRLLREGDLSRDRVEGVCKRLDRAVERAVGLLDSLLAFSRAGAPPDPHPTASMRAAVDDVLDSLESKLAQVDAKITSELADADVRCPPGILYILVLNLVGNAAKFVRDQPTREIEVHGRTARGGYELIVDDTGPGIPEDQRERVFEPFYRVPGAKPSGTGIGLATVRRIVDAYGGRICVQSSAKGGASLLVWLPAAEVQNKAEAAAEAAPKADSQGRVTASRG